MRVAPLYRVILVKIITSSRAPCCPTSRAPHHGQCLLAGPVDAEEEAGVEIVLDRAVPNVAAGVGPCGDGNRLSNSVKKRQAVAGRQWLGGGGGGRLGGGGAGFVIPQRQVLQSCFDPGWCLRFSSSTEWTVYEMACFLCVPLLCTETGTHSAFLGRRCLGNAVALWRLVKEFHIFSSCCSRSSLGIWTLFP